METKILIPHPSNLCAGNNPKTVDVKITNTCNGGCDFCIDRPGYFPSGENLGEVIRKTNELSDYGFDHLLILGGEPLMYPRLEYFLKSIKDTKRGIITTTNGSLLFKKAKMLAKYFTRIHISVHHSDEQINNGVYKTCGVSFSELKEGIAILKDHGVDVCINTLLIRGLVDSRDAVDKMVDRATWLGADTIRFREVKTFDRSLFVFADECFSGLTRRPFCEGCDTIVPYFNRITVRVKNMCGHPSEIKRKYYGVDDPAIYGQIETCGILGSLNNHHFKVNRIEDYRQLNGHTFCVLYLDGSLYDGWKLGN